MLRQDFDMKGITETWLSHDVPNDGLFLYNYTLYRKDREANSNNSKHVGVLIAVKKRFIHQEVKLQITRADFISVIVTSMSGELQICNLLNPRPPSQYTWSKEELHLLLSILESSAFPYD